MHLLNNYDAYIFDCDGVILDSNALKISAMKCTLLELKFTEQETERCVRFFSDNFGKSRFYHIQHFVNEVLDIAHEKREDFNKKILSSYSSKCTELYLKSSLTPNFIEFIESLPGDKYVASGSEQEELRNVFKLRGLDKYFREVFGSPTKKTILVKNIVEKNECKKILMIGDAVSDYEASEENGIDFVCYIPFSNVENRMNELASVEKFELLQSWPITQESEVITL